MHKMIRLLAAPLVAAALLVLGHAALVLDAAAAESAASPAGRQAPQRAALPLLNLPASAPPLAPTAAITNPLFVGVDDATVPAYRIQPATGISNPVFSGVDVWGAAYDPAGNRILFADGIFLHEWPVGAANPSLLGTIVGSESGANLVMEGLAYAHGTLYGSRVNASVEDPEGLYSIDPNTLEATLVTTYSVPASDTTISGLDAHPVSGAIYGTNDNLALRGLVRIDLDGTVTLIAPYPAGETDVDGLAIGDGKAYLITDQPGDIYVYDFNILTYTTPVPNPWANAEVFAAGAWIHQPAPAVVVSPPSLNATLLVNTQLTRTLTISNTGSANLHWLLAEQVPASALLALAPAAPVNGGPASAEAAPADEPEAPPAAALPRIALPVGGSTAYGVNVVGEAFVSLNLAAPENLITVTTGITHNFYAGDFAGDEFRVLHAIDDATDTLHRIATLNGALTTVGASAPITGHTWTGMSWDAATDTMYASSAACGSDSTLYTLNLSTGAPTPVGSITNAACIIDIAVSPNGLMYGLDILSDSLVLIDKATGAGAVIGSVGFNANFAQGMDFDPSTGLLYLASYVSGAGGRLRVADTSSGATAVVGPFGTGASTEIDAFAIAAPGCPAPDLPWLTLGETGGVVGPGDDHTVLVHFNAAGLLAGHHLGVLCLANDDPANPLVRVPVTLTVEGAGIYLPLVAATANDP